MTSKTKKIQLPGRNEQELSRRERIQNDENRMLAGLEEVRRLHGQKQFGLLDRALGRQLGFLNRVFKRRERLSFERLLATLDFLEYQASEFFAKLFPRKAIPTPSRDDLMAEALPADAGELESTPSPFAWWRTFDLAERLEWPGAPTEVDEALGARRLERWRQAPFDDADLWRRRLELDHLDAASFAHLLGETEASMRRRAGGEPAWSLKLRKLYSADEAALPAPFAWPAGSNLERVPFLPLLEPLIRSAHQELIATARSLADSSPHRLFEPEAVADVLIVSLPDLLAPIVNRALVVELHVARLEERLVGETPQERFSSFVDALRDRATAFEILSRYPVLARQASGRIDQWKRAGMTFLQHLVADAEALRESLAGGVELGLLVEAKGDVSDPHRDGRGVLLLRFDAGFRAVYKPKSMAVELAFQQLLDWFGERGLEPKLRALTVLDRGDHGWVEFVEAAPCHDAAELQRFYLRQGAYLALFYCLEGTDFHQENLIAAGEHPVYVDLETLFQPWVNLADLQGVASQPGSSLRGTVLRTDILPSRWWGTEDEAGIDMSGLASFEGQLTPRPVVAMTDRGTDSMRVERRRVEVPVSENRPRLEGCEISLLDHAGDLETGFRRLYDLAVENREALLAAEGPLAAFENTEVRVLFRTTASYGSILLESYHPHLQSDALERDRLIDRLWHAVLDRPFLAQLVTLERRDMARCDIPLFLTRPGSCQVLAWNGEPAALALESPGLDNVRAKIAALDDADLERQLAILHDSIEVLRLSSSAPPRPSYTLVPRSEPAASDELLEAAREVGEQLLGRVFETENEAMWLAVDHGEPAGWRLAPTGPDVFQGLPGIAFFLGYLGERTGEHRFSQTARRALWAQRQQIATAPQLVRGLGLFNGWGGVIYVLTHLGVLWQDDALLDEAESYARRLPGPVAEDDLLDVVAGSAGCAMALLELYRHRPSEHLLTTARACGERILQTAQPMARGVGWKMLLAGDRELAGMSHGAAGIALALLRLFAITGDLRFREAAYQGFEFERHLFDARRRNWPDLRADALDEGLDGSHGHHEMTAWCHGAPGIGLARVMGLPMADGEEIRSEIATAIETTLDRGLGQNHCLCHGDLGNLDFLLTAARALEDPDLEEKVYHLAGGVLDNLRRSGPLFGLPGNLLTPGLMTGLSGIGYGLLRLADPDRVPSILAIESASGPAGSTARVLKKSSSRGAGTGDGAVGLAASVPENSPSP